MLKKIPSSRAYKLIDNALVKGENISEVNSISRLRLQAKYEADTIINVAHRNSDALMKEGYRKGYINGMVLLFNHVIDAIEELNATLDIKRQIFLSNIKDILRKSCEDPAVIIRVFDEWVKTLPANNEEVTIHLPLNINEALTNNLLAHSMKDRLKICFHEGDNIIMYSGEYIAEFSPPAISECITEDEKEQNFCDKNERIALTNQAIEQIIDCCSMRIQKTTDEINVDTSNSDLDSSHFIE
ncbi:hypothetical protein HVW15_06915 [Escherichia fergusonii]|uniref:hypothetical protein n=1 Tax=Escherichia fergusonii TaxID=564 RepID=UPI0015F3B105|nr:hypothetical protein [Escherichia fergusonii]MBA8500744.1 hypothetical protein [Escherichia fergusonii]